MTCQGIPGKIWKVLHIRFERDKAYAQKSAGGAPVKCHLSHKHAMTLLVLTYLTFIPFICKRNHTMGPPKYRCAYVDNCMLVVFDNETAYHWWNCGVGFALQVYRHSSLQDVSTTNYSSTYFYPLRHARPFPTASLRLRDRAKDSSELVQDHRAWTTPGECCYKSKSIQYFLILPRITSFQTWTDAFILVAQW